ncbi:MAG: DNA ligase D [Pirellulaceae bacterium]
MALTEYRRKRNFRITAEPKGSRATSGRRAARGPLRFAVQKHAASHLHYDFRLELDGVLKSWAVPKGPSLDPAQKRLAMQVEDHPLEYGDFEGIIPPGEYGGGTVLLWDQGSWEPVDDGPTGYREGKLKFILHGQKLQGRWMLVRRRGKQSDSNERHWFLFKERDEFAKPGVDVTAMDSRSATTGRDLHQIAQQADRVWGSQGEQPQDGNAKGIKAERKPFPPRISVQLATLTKEAPEGDDWIHEIKFDGYRMVCRIEQKDTARFISRNGKDWTSKFPGLSEAAMQLPITSGILDGEIVVMQPDGTTSFQALQNAFQVGRSVPFLFYVFDILYLNGYDLTSAPIEDRKALLRQIIPTTSETLKYSEHVVGHGGRFFEEAARLNLEGIISKRVGRPYLPGRGHDWLKIKCSLREEFVIGGFTSPSGTRTHFGALLLGYFDRNQQLIHAGRVGAGFDDRTLATLHAKFAKLIRKESPFKDLSGRTGQARGVTWLKPSLVAQVAFSNWTDERQLRHPSFQGLREDKTATEVVRDDPVSVPAIRSATKAATMPKRKRSRPTVETNGAKSPASRVTAVTNAVTTEVAGIRLSHPDKILYPEDGISKLDLAHYYEQVASWMLPHVENRLLSLVRCPAGRGHKCFFQKHPGEGAPEQLRRFEVVEKKKTREHAAVDDLPGLISLVQMGVLEIHVWGSRADNIEKPDRLVFDLDPGPSVEWPRVVTAAKEVRGLLEELGLVSFLKTTGGKGLHVVVPIRRRTSWEDAKAFCRAVADFLVATAPNRYIATMSKAARSGKIFVDYLRNDRGATSIAPFSTRARPGATVSVPLSWEELSSRLTSDHFNIHNLTRRLARLKEDPWMGMNRSNQAIKASMLKALRSPLPRAGVG